MPAVDRIIRTDIYVNGPPHTPIRSAVSEDKAEITKVLCLRWKQNRRRPRIDDSPDGLLPPPAVPTVTVDTCRGLPYHIGHRAKRFYLPDVDRADIHPKTPNRNLHASVGA